jgi:hypothetical protein
LKIDLKAEETQKTKVVKMTSSKKLSTIEEKIRTIKGAYLNDLSKVAEICLVFDVVILGKFKVPNFDKYSSTRCSMTYL